ncbi:hypothetical protein BH23GEM10_BH23GEM10_02370 [soil metagenome]
MTTGGGYDAPTRRALEEDLGHGRPLECPYCHVALGSQDVERTPEIAYVRRRVWVICPQCRRTAGLDRRPP